MEWVRESEVKGQHFSYAKAMMVYHRLDFSGCRLNGEPVSVVVA